MSKWISNGAFVAAGLAAAFAFVSRDETDTKPSAASTGDVSQVDGLAQTATQLPADAEVHTSEHAPNNPLERSPVDRKALRDRAEAGDAEAALELAGEMSLDGDTDGAMDVLRGAAVRDDTAVQKMLEIHLRSDLFWEVRDCFRISREIVDEYLALLRVLSAKRDADAKSDLAKFLSVPDRYSRHDLAAHYFHDTLQPEDRVCKPTLWDKLPRMFRQK